MRLADLFRLLSHGRKSRGGVAAIVTVSVSTYQGYVSDGPAGASLGFGYSSADALITYGLVAVNPLAGGGLALVYNQAGGTKAAVATFARVAAIQGCLAEAGLPIVTGGN